MAQWHKFMKLLICLLLGLSLYASEAEAIRRAHSHLLIHDYQSALKECKRGLEQYPGSEGLIKAYIRTLAENGRDDEAILMWKNLETSEKQENTDLIETLCWGILSHLENSSQFAVSIAALMSAYHTDDVRAVKMLKKELSSSNALLRSLAAQLSARYRDVSLIEELIRMLSQEKVWFVRLEVIKALGLMEEQKAKEPLMQLILKKRMAVEEKGTAIASLVNIYEGIGEEELLELTTSKRAGMRYLACQIVSHLDMKDKGPLIEKLLNDPTSDVRIAALTTLYFMGFKNLSPSTLSKMVDLTDDVHPPVALAAAWVVSSFAPETSLQVIRKWVYSADQQSRRLAAYVLGRVGETGRDLSNQVLKLTPDPFVKANLALGGIGQDDASDQRADILYNFLMLRKDKLMWDETQIPYFQILSPSEICHIPQVPQYPTMVDQLTRLEVSRILSTLQHPKAEDVIKSFLKERGIGVTYAASNTLIEDGGEEAIVILRELLDEENEIIRLQAALVLALSGGEPKAVNILQDAYKLVDREMKVNILGALGYIGDKSSIPFLISLLEEPYQVLKVVAASALIQCVYH